MMMGAWSLPSGPLLVFASVLATSLGLPVPALPTLLLVAAGLAMHPQTQAAMLAGTFAASVCASMVGDTVWYALGRRYGGKTLRALCWLSVSRDTCVRQTESVYTRFGVRVLAVAKFIPGLSLVAVPLAGALQVRPLVFAGYNVIGAMLWAGVGLTFGTLFADRITQLLATLVRTGAEAGILALCALLLYLGYRLWRRLSLMRTLKTARIDVKTLYTLMRGDPPALIFDVRSEATRSLTPLTIPGARVVSLNGQLTNLEPEDRHRPMVIYCACPNEVSAAMYAERLRREGYDRVHVLRGGMDAWAAANEVLTPTTPGMPSP